MALIDVGFLLVDPDFIDKVTLIKRSSIINVYGEMSLIETATEIFASVQNSKGGEKLDRFVDSARLSDDIEVFYKGVLQAESPGGYADIILWKGKRYQVKLVAEDYINFGEGFTKAICFLEDVSV